MGVKEGGRYYPNIRYHFGLLLIYNTHPWEQFRKGGQTPNIGFKPTTSGCINLFLSLNSDLMCGVMNVGSQLDNVIVLNGKWDDMSKI